MRSGRYGTPDPVAPASGCGRGTGTASGADTRRPGCSDGPVACSRRRCTARRGGSTARSPSYVTGQSTSTPSREAARKSMSPNRGDDRPQKLALPPTSYPRPLDSVPGAVVYGIRAPRGLRCTRLVVYRDLLGSADRRSRGTACPRPGGDGGNPLGSSRRPAFIAQTSSPASQSV